MRRTMGGAALAAVACLVAAPPAIADPRCKPDVRALPTLGGDEGAVMDFAPGGVAVGGAQDAQGNNTAVLWRDGRVHELGLPRGDSEAMDVNGAGVVVGTYDHSDDPTTSRAFRWRDGELETLPGLLDHGRGTGARRINEHGTIVGGAVDHLGREQPVRWRRGRLERLGPLPAPYTAGSALGINETGEISGSLYEDSFSPPVPFVWSDGDFTVVPALAGPASPAGPFGEVNLIDDRGVAAGASDDTDGRPTATLWRNGVARPLGQLPGGTFSQVLGTDGHGRYTGWAVGADDEAHAFVSDGDGLRPLTGLSGDPSHFSMAHAIDDRGDVGGISADAEGIARPTVWRCAFAWRAGR